MVKLKALSSGKTKVICTSESGKEKALQVIVNEKIETTVEENTDEDEYIFAHSDTELLTEADLENKDDSQLRLDLMKFMPDIIVRLKHLRLQTILNLKVGIVQTKL